MGHPRLPASGVRIASSSPGKATSLTRDGGLPSATALAGSDQPGTPCNRARRCCVTWRGPLFLRDLLLVVLTLAALEGVCDCGWVDPDDDDYVATNPYAKNGLSRENVAGRSPPGMRPTGTR